MWRDPVATEHAEGRMILGLEDVLRRDRGGVVTEEGAIRANVVPHRRTSRADGGVVPEIASRRHLEP